MLRALQRGGQRGFRVSKQTATIEEQVRKEVLKEKTHYELLGVQSAASSQQIREAYLRLARQIHPDLTGKPSDEFSAVTRAYQILSDPHQRVIYDESLIPDSDYYSVKIGSKRIALKWLLGSSVSLVLLALAIGEAQGRGDNAPCPTTHRLKKMGASQQNDETPQAEKPVNDVKWSKAPKPAAPIHSSSGELRKPIFHEKETSSTTQSAPQVVAIKLPKDRSFPSE